MIKQLILLIAIALTSGCLSTIESVANQTQDKKPYQSMLLVFPIEVLDYNSYSNKVMTHFYQNLKSKQIAVDTMSFKVNALDLTLNSNSAINQKIDSLVKKQNIDAVFFMTIVRVTPNSFTYACSVKDIKTLNEVWKANVRMSNKGSLQTYTKKIAQRIYLKLVEDKIL